MIFPENIFYKIDTVSEEITKFAISLQIDEEINKILEGNISFYDPNYAIGNLLPFGKKITITWGYKTILNIYPEINKLNPNEIRKTGLRARTIECIIQKVSYSADNTGNIIYNVTFFGKEFENNFENREFYQDGTKRSLINQKLLELGVIKTTVEFRRGNENLEPPVVQQEPNFQFLKRLADEWDCFFQVLNGSGIFVDSAKVGEKQQTGYLNQITQTTGNYFTINYNTRDGNIKSWSGEEVLGGNGDHVVLQEINGQIIPAIIRVEDQKVTTLQLDVKDLEKFIDENSLNKSLLGDIISAKFEYDAVIGGKRTIGSFFKPTESTTAPQGNGISLSLEMRGDPLFTPPMRIILGDGFPPNWSKYGENDFNRFYLQKVTHKIGEDYNMSVKIGDMLSSFGGFIASGTL